MGYMQKWDLTQLLKKLEEVSKREQKLSYKADIFDEAAMLGGASAQKKPSQMADTSTFVTGVDAGGASKQPRIEFEDGDVKLVLRWGAHTDCINWISYITELNCVASCSFDCNVYMWNTEC